MDNKKAAFSGSLAQGTQGHSSTPPLPANSQCRMILDLLQAHGGITNYELHRRGINAAPARIKELRDSGHPIADRWETMINQFGREVRFKVYYLAGMKGAGQ